MSFFGRMGVALFILCLLISGLFFLVGQALPGELVLIQGKDHSLDLFWPLPVEVKQAEDQKLYVNGMPLTQEFEVFPWGETIEFYGPEQGQIRLQFRVLGFFPLPEMVVDVVPEMSVVPSGEAIGVLMQSQGVMVVEIVHIVGEEGNHVHPARDAGLHPGDVILAINGVKVENKLDVARKIHESRGETLTLTVQSWGTEDAPHTLQLKPEKSAHGQYMVGMYINDGVAGVGTLTFYDPKTYMYGALGHIITENYTRLPLQMGGGQIVEAHIAGISMGTRGIPGEKYGAFYHDEGILGDISMNTHFGIFGQLHASQFQKRKEETLPVASALQVEKGPAEMYTVVEGRTVEKFAIEIERVTKQYQPQDKGMVIRVVDERLLETTGGIIQGMSGSPIIQGGQLIGAVTHVFINDPRRGYGIMAEWMLREAQRMGKEDIDTKKIS